MELLLFWVVLGIVVALIANSKGRNAGGWFIYGLIIWPVALVHILLSSKTAEARIQDAKAEGRVPCPQCAELIKKEARVCPFCRRDLGAVSSS